MAITIVGTPNVQSNTSSGSDKTLTFPSDTYGPDEIITIDVMGNNSDTNIPITNLPVGGSLTWTQIQTASHAGTGGRTSSWWAATGAGGTYAVTQQTTRNGAVNLSTRGLLTRRSGAHLTVPIGQVDIHDAATDPLTSNTLLRLLNVLAGSSIGVVGGDWSAQTTITLAFDNSIADTEHINALESAQMHFCAFRSTDPLPSNIAELRASLDASAATGDWNCVMYEILDAGGGAPAAGLTADPVALYEIFIHNRVMDLPVWAGSPAAEPEGTNAPAEAATATGTAADATTTIAPSAGVASATGTASTAQASVKPSAGAASATGTSSSATVTISPAAGVASATGTAAGATVKVAPQAGAASGTGTASDATVTTGTAAPATAASGTGTANPATVAIAPTAGVASGTGTANAVTAKVAPVIGSASGTGTASDATVVTGSFTSANAEAASASGTAGAATAKIAPQAGSASGTGTANPPTVKVSTPAGVASATGTASSATIAISVNAGSASATGMAAAGTASIKATAGSASGVGTAMSATVFIGLLVVSPERTFTVSPEPRLFTVAAESRTFTVRAEARTFSVPVDDREFDVRPESRTQLVEAP